MHDEALTATEIDLIRRAAKACLITFAFTVLAMKQSYFDYPVAAMSCVIFAVSLLNSTVKFSRNLIGYLLILVVIPPQSAPMIKESITYFFSLLHS